MTAATARGAGAVHVNSGEPGEDIASRFEHVVVGFGNGIPTAQAAAFAHAGRTVTVADLRGYVSGTLALAGQPVPYTEDDRAVAATA